jgi:hypothetical protein
MSMTGLEMISVAGRTPRDRIPSRSGALRFSQVIESAWKMLIAPRMDFIRE